LSEDSLDDGSTYYYIDEEYPNEDESPEEGDDYDEEVPIEED
jgi:hypothetical protein